MMICVFFLILRYELAEIFKTATMQTDERNFLFRGCFMPNVEMKGIVVEGSIGDNVISNPHDGLYLKPDDGGDLLELISGSMAQQIPVEVMWRQSRKNFEAHIGQHVIVRGYKSGRTIYSAWAEPFVENSDDD
jgi:hypothetical protein